MRRCVRPMSDDYVDTDEVIRLAFEQAAKARPDGGSELLDTMGTIIAVQWLIVIAASQIFRSISRKPSREHLVHMVDLFLAYVRRGGSRRERRDFDPALFERLEPAALHLRALLESWSQPDLPEEI